MDILEAQALYVFIYKLSCLSVGMGTIYLGYKLFVKGVYTSAGDFAASSGSDDSPAAFNVTLKKAAPGTFFAFFGMLVIGFTIQEGIKYSGKNHSENKAEPVEIVIPKPK